MNHIERMKKAKLFAEERKAMKDNSKANQADLIKVKSDKVENKKPTMDITAEDYETITGEKYE